MTAWKDLTRQQKGDVIRPMIEEQQLSYAQIGKLLGVSRVAIAGAADRNHIKSPYSRGVPKGIGYAGGAANVARKKSDAARKLRKPTKPRPTVSAVRPLPSLPLIDLPPKAPWNPDAWLALPGTTPIALHETTDRTCRWPIGTEMPFSFCGAPATPGKPYCATHNALAYKPMPERQFNGRKTG